MKDAFIRLTGLLHESCVHGRRVARLHRHLAEMLPHDTASLLDVGCGDGLLTSLLRDDRPGTRFQGVDVLVRPGAKIDVRQFDGSTLPFPGKSFDAVAFVDVLHHTTDPGRLIAEAARVASRYVIVKDHVRSGPVSAAILKFMDWVGNRSHGVALPNNYLTEAEMAEIAGLHELHCERCITKLNLYPAGVSWIFDGKLHFIARYRVSAPSDHGH